MDRLIVTEEMERYLHDITPARHPVVQEMEAFADKHGFPIVGPLVGRLLFTVARAVHARHVFECGSGYGYSTFWFAEAVGRSGEVVHTDGSERNSARAKDYLGRAGVSDRVRFHVGDARELLRAEAGPFDIIFCDIDKDGYPDVPELAVPRLRTGGLLIFDNMLWHGRVLDTDPDEETRGVHRVTEILYGHPDLATSIVPLRDGVSISVKL